MSRGVELVELAWGVEVSSWCRGLVSRCRGQGSARVESESAFFNLLERCDKMKAKMKALPCVQLQDEY